MYEPRTMILDGMPWVRLTYLFHDTDGDRLGFGVCVFSCVECGEVEFVKYGTMKEIEMDVLGDHGHPELRATRDRFQRAHKAHV